MDDLISRQELLDAFENADTDVLADTDWWHSAEFGFSLKKVREIVAGVRTIDAQPVQHGHWIARHIEGEDPFECSVCGNTVPFLGFRTCPSCKAKMDIPDYPGAIATTGG